MHIETKIWGKGPDGEDVRLFTMENEHGVRVQLCEIGAGIVSLWTPDRDGRMADIVLGYAKPEDYFGDGPCMGKVPGRSANRIAHGRFCLDGETYQLDLNTAGGKHHLHGGAMGFANRLWKGEVVDDSVVFTYTAADGEQGYPGKLTATVRYTLTDFNTLCVDLQAVTDKPTVVNLTNHTYFNLKGEGDGDILDHDLRVFAGQYLATDDDLVPTGEMCSVEGTPMDFREEKRIGRDINADFDALRAGKGYDSCWVLDKDDNTMTMAAQLSHEGTGRLVGIATTQRGLQVYTGNWLEGCPQGKNGHRYHDYSGVALECQALPDAPNHAHFHSTILREGETYHESIIFYFLTF
ncbi:MAG: galactose mutarotase [Bacteroidales bacterium]|nr:galactose mutarotase [Bacteroidales bacterium]